jgi:hypothetical protein
MSTARRRTIRRSIWILLTLTLVSLLAVAGCGEPGGQALTYSFKTGDAFTYDLEVVMNGSMTAPGMTADEGTLPKDATVKGRFSIKVTDVKDDVATIVYTYESLETIAEGETETIPVDQIPAVTVTMDKFGKITSMSGAAGGVLGSLMGGGNESAGLPFDASQLGGSAMVSLPPGGKLAVGEEWTTTTDTPVPMLGQSVQTTTKAKITSLTKEGDNQIVGLDFDQDTPMDLSIDLGALMGQMIPAGTSDSLPEDFAFLMTLAGTQSFSGATTVNLTKGLPVNYEADGVMKYQLAISEAPEDMVPADERGPFDIDITMKIRLSQVT